MDHVQFLIIAQAYGVKNLKDIEYVSLDGDGTKEVLTGRIDLFSTSLADTMELIESGELKCLAQTADKRIGTGKKAEIPTCNEMGIDATFSTWRGLFGCPGMPDYAVKYWRTALERLHNSPEWQKVCQEYGWDDIYLDSPDFEDFLKATEREYIGVMNAIGMLAK